MHSSTSNSNRTSSVTIKSLITFFVMWFIYTILILLVRPDITIMQNHNSTNIAAAQNYIYYKKNSKKIIVGSSMARRLDRDILKEKAYNLSLAGGSPLTSLEIIYKSNASPETIIIEVNTIYKKSDTTMIEELFKPYLWKVKEYIPSLQHQYEPINIILSLMKKGASEKVLKRNRMNTENFNRMLKLRLSEDKKVDNEVLEASLEQLKKTIKKIKKRGTEVVFFEMPIAKELRRGKKHSQVVNAIKSDSYFSKFRWIEIPQDNLYQTTDGIHLTFESSKRFTKELTNKL